MSNTTSLNNPIVDPSNQIKYIIMQIFQIPSILCSVFTLIPLISKRQLRLTIHNHISLALLIISTFDLLLNHPFTLNYLRTGHATPSTNAMCISWNFFNGLFTTSIYWTMAWGSAQRPLLIFYSSLFATHRRRILFHYVPLFLTTIIYPIAVVIVIHLLYPCTNQFNMASLFCGYTCALKIPSVALFYRIANNFIPVFIITGTAIYLVIRVVKQRRQMQSNRSHWRRSRRMIIQLLVPASLFLILTLPSVAVGIAQNCCIPTFAAALQVPYFTFIVRFSTILMPFVCLSSLPEIRSKLLLCQNAEVGSVATARPGTIPAR